MCICIYIYTCTCTCSQGSWVCLLGVCGQIRVSMKTGLTKGISRCFWNCQFPSECRSQPEIVITKWSLGGNCEHLTWGQWRVLQLVQPPAGLMAWLLQKRAILCCCKTTKKHNLWESKPSKKLKKSRLCEVPTGDSGKPPPKSILIAICEVFLVGLLHPPYLYLALFGFI